MILEKAFDEALTSEHTERRTDPRAQRGRIVLKKNKKKIVFRDFYSLFALLVPAVLFGVGLLYLSHADARFAWFRSPSLYPWELWTLIICGSIATIGGIADWTYHRIFVAAGPKERKSHFLALATGGVPLALLMCWASIAANPLQLLLPIIVVVLYTSTLICYDEFVFHRKRCKAFETLTHRLLVFGNGFAWLAWMHWCFVRGGLNAL